MRHSNDIDDAVNDVIMVVNHQQNRRLFLYNTRFTPLKALIPNLGFRSEVV